jgi:hypothetical protein
MGVKRIKLRQSLFVDVLFLFLSITEYVMLL